MQFDLINAVVKCLDRHGTKTLNARQYNAIVKGVNLMLEEIEQPNRPATPGMGLLAWLQSDDTGASSMCMARKLAPLVEFYGVPGPDDVHYPRDPADFGRCVRLLEAAPELRPYIARMAGCGEQWTALAGAWDELEALYREELPSGTAPKLYARMKELLAVQ